MGCHFLLQEIFLIQGLNPGLLHCRQTLYHLSHQGSPHPEVLIKSFMLYIIASILTYTGSLYHFHYLYPNHHPLLYLWKPQIQSLKTLSSRSHLLRTQRKREREKERDAEGLGGWKGAGQEERRESAFSSHLQAWKDEHPRGFPLLLAWQPRKPGLQGMWEWAQCSETKQVRFPLDCHESLDGCALHVQSMFLVELFNQHLIQMEKEPSASC